MAKQLPACEKEWLSSLFCFAEHTAFALPTELSSSQPTSSFTITLVILSPILLVAGEKAAA